jgi:hypothetical protein
LPISIISNAENVPYAVISIIRDISERKKIETDLIEAKEKAEELATQIQGTVIDYQKRYEMIPETDSGTPIPGISIPL